MGVTTYNQNDPVRIMGDGSTSFNSGIQAKEEGKLALSGAPEAIRTKLTQIDNVVITALDSTALTATAAGFHVSLAEPVGDADYGILTVTFGASGAGGKANFKIEGKIV